MGLGDVQHTVVTGIQSFHKDCEQGLPGDNVGLLLRNVRRDAIQHIRELVKEKEAAEDEAHRAEDDVQKLTDRHIESIDEVLAAKEADLLEI